MTILIFFIALAILILSHELGHFIAAKKSGIKVEEFGFGFPPRLFGIKKGETTYSINAIPFGGFVKIFGEDDISQKKKDSAPDFCQPESFAEKPFYIKTMVLVAGVFFNLLLAWVLLTIVFATGAPTGVGEEGAGAITIVEVQPATPAEKAGFLPGDQLVRLSSGGETLETESITKVQEFISRNKGKEIQIDYLRGKEQLSVSVIPDEDPEKGKGALGIAMEKIGLVASPWYLAIWEGLKATIFVTGAIVKALVLLVASLIRGAGATIQVMGPVGIAGLVGTAAQSGFVYVIQLVALLSINLAIINLLPFPALDGGRLLFLAVERIKRSPVNQKTMQMANSIGFMILIALMLLITYRDIVKLIFN